MKICRTLMCAAALSVALVFCAGCRPAKKNAAVPAVLSVTTDPAGASVEIDGRKFKTTPSKIGMPEGVFLLKLSRDGYVPQWQMVKIARGETKKIDVRLAPEEVSVLIVSTPAGAELRDKEGGKLLGTTPCVLSGQRRGTHELVLSAPGYAPRPVSFSIQDARPQMLSVNLVSNVGRIQIGSVPKDAQIFFDGHSVGRTPVQREMRTGRYLVRCEKSGYQGEEKMLEVVRDRTARLHFNLASLPGSLGVSCNVRDAMIILDGKEAGVTDSVLKDIAYGIHTVKVVKEGFDTAEKRIEVPRGGRVNVEFNISVNTGGIDLAVAPPGATVYLDGRLMAQALGERGAKISRVIQLRDIAPGKHQLMVVHKRARPDRRQRSVVVQKGVVTRLGNFDMWVPNAILVLRRDGLEREGIVVSQTPEAVVFEQDKGVRIPYQRKDIKDLKWLKLEE
ncbi:MAG: PEGA domain-containing protein [Victivallaceae bacterium]|nr:PEGA domain-containing protein [Victivallaceae bacterium]